MKDKEDETNDLNPQNKNEQGQKIEEDKNNNDNDFTNIPKKSQSEIIQNDKNEMKKLDDELISLRCKLHQMKFEKEQLQNQLNTIHQSTKPMLNEMQKNVDIIHHQQSDNAVDRGTMIKKIEDSINAAMIGKNGLEELCKNGQDIIQKLNDIKENRRNTPNNNDENNNNDVNINSNETKEFSDRNRPRQKCYTIYKKKCKVPRSE